MTEETLEIIFRSGIGGEIIILIGFLYVLYRKRIEKWMNK